jgi:O-antigen/teichoic acid export membrane protein
LALVLLAAIAVRAAPIYSAGALAAFGFAAVILWMGSRTHLSGARPVPSTREIRAYSTASAIGTISILANARLDQMLMPATSSSRDLGLYAVAVTVAEVPLILGVLASRNALNIAGRGGSVLEVLRETRFYLAVAVVLSILAFGVAPLLVPFVFGAPFAASNAAVRILAVSIPFNVATEVVTSIFFGRGRPKLGSLVPFIGTVVTGLSFAALWGHITPSTAAWIALASQGSAAVFGSAALWMNRRPIPTGIDRA